MPSTHILRPDGALTASMRETVCGAAFGYPTTEDHTFATISRTTFRAYELGDHEHVTCKRCLRRVMVDDQPKHAPQTAYRSRQVAKGSKQQSFLLSAEAVEKLERLAVTSRSRGDPTRQWPEAYRVIQRETTRLVIWVATEPDWTA